jgi:hypothetical protein
MYNNNTYEYSRFDGLFEERFKRNIRRRFIYVLEDIRIYKPFPIEEVITRRRSTTFRDGELLLNTHTIQIL